MENNIIYKELYHYDDKHSLVMNEITHDVCFMKTLTHYDIAVYQYIKDHPNKYVPRIYDIIEQGNTLCVVEEYIQGSSFDSIIYSGRLSDEAKLNYFIKLCYGIKYLHDAPQHIIHRDIKLSNIIIAENGDLKVIDYDAAKIYKPGSKKDTALIGTEGMAAPEQYGFRQSDERTDIYAVGLLLKEAFPNNKRLLQVAEKASAFDPNNRYRDISELISALTNGPSAGKLNPLFPFPGFRTGVWYKMVISSAFWMTIISTAIVNIFVYERKPVTGFGYAMLVLLSALFGMDLFMDWTGFWLMLPGMKLKGKDNILIKIGYFVVVEIILLICCFFCIAVLEGERIV